MEKINNDNNFDLQFKELEENKEYEQTRQALNAIRFSIFRMRNPDDNLYNVYENRIITDIVKGVKDFLSMIPNDNMKQSMDHLLLFQFYYLPIDLVSLFNSPIKGNKEIGEESIRLFLINPKSKTGFLPKPIQNQCALIVSMFCNFLGGISTNTDDDQQCLLLSNSCRETFISILKSIDFAKTRSTYYGFTKPSFLIEQLHPEFQELSNKLSKGLNLIEEQPSLSKVSNSVRLRFVRDIREFALFSLHMCRAIEEHVTSVGQSLPLCMDDDAFNEENPCYSFEIFMTYHNFASLILDLDMSLSNLVEDSASGVTKFNPMWSYYLPILKELNNISKLFQGAEKKVSNCLESHWLTLNYIILNSKKSDEHQWILERKNAISFESKRDCMMTLMFPIVNYDDQMPHKMLIDRSKLLTESFEQITNANRIMLQIGLSVMFKNESASGDGVLREWLFLVCKALFDQENSLFLACPSDQRRFFPNPARLDSQHLKYFGFCGRAIALSLMHEVQIGITFDRVFFLQLAGKKVSLEDVRCADPFMYNSCKKILEMDADFVDSDAMGLTFVREIEEFGCRKEVELCPGGNSIVVNSKNREEYVNLLIQHCFVKSISTKVAYFARGFGDIFHNPKFCKIFFKTLDLEDFDCLLLGSDKKICIKDWKAQTDYIDYEETDDQICWFWKVVEEMSTEQQRALLFFWTSVKYLPYNGFSGLSSALYIYKNEGSQYHLPSSRTCFYRLGLPCYPSLAVMQQNLYFICQDCVENGFGDL